MKRLLLAALLSSSLAGYAQKTPYAFQTIPLPPEIADRNNQFSGLHLYQGELLLLSESRLQERAEAKLYGLDLSSLDKLLAGQAVSLSYKKYALQGLELIRARLDSAGQVYEGLEGLTMLGDTAYFTIETTTPSAYCYLIRGRLRADTTLALDSRYLVPLAKPVLTDGSHIHNAGFEAATGYNGSLLLFFEYNHFRHDNYALRLPSALRLPDIPQQVPMQRLPFRLTDLTYEGRNRFTAINYFYNGAEDSVYRPAPDDASHQLIRSGTAYQNYCRLVRLHYRRGRVSWKPLLELPREYMTYNWEGLAAYRGGYFLINDKYGPSNQSTLLYVRKK